MEQPLAPEESATSADEEIATPGDADPEALLDGESDESDDRPPAMYADLVGLEADEADVMEQAQPVPEDEDDRDRG